MYTFYSRGSDPASGSAASTVNRFYRRFDRLSGVKIADTVGPVMRNDTGGANDQVCAARSSPDRRRCFTELRTTSAGELTIRTLRNRVERVRDQRR